MVLRSRGRFLPLLFRPVRRYRKLDRKTNHTRIDHSIDTWGDETLDFAQAEETRDALNEERPLFEDRDLGSNTFEWRDPVFDEDRKNYNSEVPGADDDVASLEGLLGGPYQSEILGENRQVKKKDGVVHLKYSVTRENSTFVNKWSSVRNIFANRVQPNRKVPKKEGHPWRQKVMNTPRIFSNNNLPNEKDKTGDILRYLRDGGRTKERGNDEGFVVSQEDPHIAHSYDKSEVPKQKRSGFGIQNFMKNRRRDLRRKTKMKETAIDDLSEASDISGSEVISFGGSSISSGFDAKDIDPFDSFLETLDSIVNLDVLCHEDKPNKRPSAKRNGYPMRKSERDINDPLPIRSRRSGYC